MNIEEQQYLDLLKKVMDTGVDRKDRTGVGSRSGFFGTMVFDLSKSFPLFTSRFTPFRLAFEEMMMFARGECDTKTLTDKNIHIWEGNTSREFLDSRGLYDLPEYSLGKSYSWQIRNFGGTEPGNGFDQLKYLIDNIKSNPSDRRHLMNYWHGPQMLKEAALPCCHLLYNCQVVEGRLNAVFYMRSHDLACAGGLNVAGYAYWTHMIAKICGLQPGTLAYVACDPHIYHNHFDGVKELITREPKPFPQFRFKKDFTTLDEALALTYDDVEIIGYEHNGKMKFEMAI